MGSYLIYHPRSCLFVFGDLKVYHDPIGMVAMNERMRHLDIQFDSQ